MFATHTARTVRLSLLTAAILAIAPVMASAKLPALSPEAKAKADEEKAKSEFSDKQAAYQLCLAQDRVAATYLKQRAGSGSPATPTAGLPACKDPGTYQAGKGGQDGSQEAARVGIADSLPLNKEPVKK